MTSRMLVGLAPGQAIVMAAPSVRMMSKRVRVGSAEFEVYSIGHLALATGRSTHTLRRWQRNKVIPAPIINAGDGSRWYLKEELEVYKRVMESFRLTTGVDIEATGFPVTITAEIQQLRDQIRKQTTPSPARK